MTMTIYSNELLLKCPLDVKCYIFNTTADIIVYRSNVSTQIIDQLQFNQFNRELQTFTGIFLASVYFLWIRIIVWISYGI